MSNDVARYRRLYNHEWHSPEFRRLNDSARIVRFYVTAGPQTTSVGCFRLSTALAVEDLGGTSGDFEHRLEDVCEAYGWAWDPLARVIWIRDWFDSNPPASPNVVASWAKLLKNVPNCDVKDEAIVSIATSLKNLPHSFREPFADLARTSRRSEVRPEVQPETNQGSGNREQFSGSRGTGARRANGSERNGAKSTAMPTDERLASIARETLKIVSPHLAQEDLVESFRHTARMRNIDGLQKADIVAALALAKSEQRPA